MTVLLFYAYEFFVIFYFSKRIFKLHIISNLYAKSKIFGIVRHDKLLDGFFEFNSIKRHIAGAVEANYAYVASNAQNLKLSTAARVIFLHFNHVIDKELYDFHSSTSKKLYTQLL